MKRQTTASAVNFGMRNVRPPASATRPRSGRLDSPRGAGPPRRPRLRLADASVRAHTLVLKGELNHGSAHALEAEIERLCDEHVTGITLDLRELEAIDATGVAVIAFRSGLCKRRGFDFAVIQGPREVQSAFEQAGVAESLSFHTVRPEAPALPA
jgi:anti-anti-sigma factor